MDIQDEVRDVSRDVILTGKEMKVVQLIREGNVKAKDIADKMKFTVHHVRRIMYEMIEMGWILWDEVKGYSIDETYTYRVTKLRNGEVVDDDREVRKKRDPLKATFERKNIVHTPPETTTYFISPEEAKQMFIEKTRHMPFLEYKKGVLTKNENYRSPNHSG